MSKGAPSRHGNDLRRSCISCERGPQQLCVCVCVCVCVICVYISVCVQAVSMCIYTVCVCVCVCVCVLQIDALDLKPKEVLLYFIVNHSTGPDCQCLTLLTLYVSGEI